MTRADLTRPDLAHSQTHADSPPRRRPRVPLALTTYAGAFALGVIWFFIAGLVVSRLFLGSSPASHNLAAMDTHVAPSGTLDLESPASLAERPTPRALHPVVTSTLVTPVTSVTPVTPAPAPSPTPSSAPRTRKSSERQQHEQQQIREARRKILACKPDTSLIHATVLLARSPQGTVTLSFNGNPVHGQFGRCVAALAAEALGSSERLSFSL